MAFWIPEKHKVLEPNGLMSRPWMALFQQITQVLGTIVSPAGVAPMNFRDTQANQPLATDPTTPLGTLYFITDKNIIQRSTGLAWESWGPFFESSLGVLTQPVIETVSPIHVSVEDRGLQPSNLAPSQYVMLAESEDAVIGLASENEGGHGSGIDLMEVDGGVLADKWFVGRLSSGISNSEFVWYYGANADYGLNTRMMTLTTGRMLALGSLAAGNPALKPNGAELQFRLANDSANANIVSGLHTIQRSGSSPTFGTWVNAGNPLIVGFAETTVGDGDSVYAMASNTATARPVFLLRKARGTLAAPSPLQNGDVIGSFLASGRSNVPDFQNTAAIEFVVFGAPAGSSVPTSITFVTGATGAGRTTKLAITDTGLVKFGSVTATTTIPALKASSAELHCQLGDDSDFAVFRAKLNGNDIVVPVYANMLMLMGG